MDKAEYQSRLKELNSLVKKEDYEGALAVVEAVDWRRVKSLRTLGMVADVYEANKRYPEAKKILLMAYDHSSIGKGILYRLVEVSVKMKDFDEAIDFYNEFEAVARHDNSRYLLKYKILRGQKAPLEEQISLLEEYKEREFTERWAYELANLYSKAGETQKCIDACDELILWFSEGKYVTKAMDLKMKYEPLSPSQQIKYEHRFDYKKNEEPSEDPEALEVRLAGESGAGEMAATKEPAETPEVKPVNGGVMSQYVAGEEEKEAGSPYEAYEKTQQAEADAEQVQEYEALQQTEEPIEEIPEEQAYADSMRLARHGRYGRLRQLERFHRALQQRVPPERHHGLYDPVWHQFQRLFSHPHAQIPSGVPHRGDPRLSRRHFRIRRAHRL